MLKVLVVDDAKIIHHIIRVYLTGLNLEFFNAYNGHEALDLLAEHRFGLIISDLNMPELDGITLCKKIKNHPRHASTPVVLLTSSGTDENIKLAADAGSDGFLHKPIVEQKFISTIKTLLKID